MKLLITNLNYEVDLNLLAEEFSTCGAVMRCRIINGLDGRSRGTAFVSYADKASADRAISKYHDRCKAVIVKAFGEFDIMFFIFRRKSVAHVKTQV